METRVDIEAANRECSGRQIIARASVRVALFHENTNNLGWVIASDAPGHGTSALSCRLEAHFARPDPRCRTGLGRTTLALMAQAID